MEAPEVPTLLELFRNASFWKNPENIWLNLAKIQQHFGKFAKFWKKTEKNSVIFNENFEIREAVQRSALCRSRRELSNEYLLAKFGFDTAENEPI